MEEIKYFEKIAERGQLIVISGPSSVGKRTVIDAYIKEHPIACRCITVTTREQRPDEEDGREHYFLSQIEFERLIRTQQMLDYSYYNRNGYGTTRKAVEDARNAGKNVLMIADVVGAMKIRSLCSDATLIFLLSTDWEELESRIRKRHEGNPELIESLLFEAKESIVCATQYDYILVNDTIEKTVRRLGQIIHGNRFSKVSMQAFLKDYVEGEIMTDLASEILSL